MTVERVTIEAGNSPVEQQHLARYHYAGKFVKGKTVLDIACGTGYGSKILHDAGAAQVVGVDLSPDAVEQARQLATPGLSFEQGDAQALAGHADGRFDSIVSFETIEHVPNDDAYLDQMHRVLRAGGEFIVSTPDFRLGSIRQRLTGTMRNPFHVREYTLRQLLRKLTPRFDVVELAGQMLVAKWRVLLPVDIATKAFCYTLAGERGRAYVQRHYYPPSSEVVPVSSAYVPNFWVIRCIKR